MKTPTYAEFIEMVKLDPGEQDSWEYRFHRLALALWNSQIDYEKTPSYYGRKVTEEIIKDNFSNQLHEAKKQINQ